MSSNGGTSRKEKEVIEQQRKLAALLAKRGSAEAKKSSSSAVRPKPSASSSLHRKPAVKPPAAAAAAAALAHKPKPKGGTQKVAPENSQKRPIRPGLKRPTASSASSILAAARAKAGTGTGTGTDPRNAKNPPAGKNVIEIKDSPKLQRKVKSAESTGNRLASLVKNVSSAAPKDGNDSLTSAAFGSNVTPEDFWRNIRDWDFVSDLANQVNEKDETALTTRKPIPETFISFRHYISLWAPLSLAEARAQLISELMTSSNQQGNRANLFVPVEVETTWKGGGRRDRGLHTDLIDMDACSVKLKTRERSKGPVHFFANDVFCLIPTECKDTVEMLMSGKTVKNTDGSFKRFCLVGHTEVQRKEIDGLILKVSKRKWAQVGTSSMFLLRVGANITALREFTALCGVETIPLKRFLLGHHLEGTAKNNGSMVVSSAANMGKEALLKKMGGVQALGKGFTEYAQKKFNPSQLHAISASAHGCKFQFVELRGFLYLSSSGICTSLINNLFNRWGRWNHIDQGSTRNRSK
jgi:hypothetical protein